VGNKIGSSSFDAFVDELEKIGGILDFIGKKNLVSQGLRGRIFGTVNAGKNLMFGEPGSVRERFGHGIGNALHEGWRDMSPRYSLQDARKKGVAAFKKRLEPSFGLAPGPHLTEHPNPIGFKSWFSGAADPGKNRLQVAAEELSRRGWTGEGATTKYLPIGTKSLGVGLSGMAIPEIVNAPKPDHTSEGGALERSMGELGGIGGIIAGSGLGLVPNVGVFMGAKHLGSKAGRVLDRIRGGASIRDAVSAPSPGEVESQLSKIQKYYG
jgi:hypothetical protein